MKTLSFEPFLAVDRPDRGYLVVCSPGPLADLLTGLSGEQARPCTAWVFPDGNGSIWAPLPHGQPRPAVAIPYSDKLDEALTYLVDGLISLRYETGQVQLRLKLDLGEEMKL